MSASSSYDTTKFPVWKAFDDGGVSGSKSYWISGGSTYSLGPGAGTHIGSVASGEYLQIQTPAPYQLQNYRLFGSSNHYLSSFAILGSSDLQTWTTIDQRTNQDCRGEQTFIAPAQTATFLYFRLIITQDQTTEGSNYTVVSNFAPVFTDGTGGSTNADWNATSGSTQILNKPTKLTQFTNDLTGSSGDWNVPGALTANTSINVPNGGTNVLNLGSNLTKETNAGKIGYALLTTGGLDIVGAGTAAGSRVVKLWDNVTVPGTLAVAGSISTPALTVAGASVFAQVNADWNATSGVAQILNKPTSVGGGGGGGGGSFAMPAMTSNTGNGYTVSASSTCSATYPAWNAFDSSQATYWFSGSAYYSTTGSATYQQGNYIGNVSTGGVAGEYLQIQTPAQFILLSYSLYASYYDYLNDFSIMGSNDLSTWTTIDTRTNQNCRTQQTYTAPAQTTAFTYFRLIISRDVSTTTGQDCAPVSNFAPVFSSVAVADWNATSGSTQILNKPTKLTQFTNDLTGSSGDWNVPGALTANTSINVPNGGTNVLNLGSNLTKETNAGKIGYALLTTAGLDIVGAGTAAGSRVVKLWDNVIIPGNLSVTGTATTGALTSSSITTSGTASTGALTSSSITTSGTASTGALTSSSITATALLTANTGVNVLGSNVLNFGSNVTKESNAGKIGYQTIDVGYLNIIGAGTSVGTRQTKFYDNVTVNQDTNINRNLAVTGRHAAGRKPIYQGVHSERVRACRRGIQFIHLAVGCHR